MLTALSFALLTPATGFAVDRRPAHVHIDCAHIVGSEGSNQTSSQKFELSSEGRSGHLFGAFAAPDHGSFLFTLVEHGTLISRVEGEQEFAGTSYVLIVSRVSDPMDRLRSVSIPRDSGAETYEIARDPLAAGKLRGEHSAWIEISSKADGTIEASVIQGNQRVKSRDGVLDIDLRYVMKSDRHELESSGRYFLGMPVERVLNPVHRTFSMLANKTLGVGYQVDFHLKLSLKFSAQGPPDLAIDVNSQRN